MKNVLAIALIALACVACGRDVKNHATDVKGAMTAPQNERPTREDLNAAIRAQNERELAERAAARSKRQAN